MSSQHRNPQLKIRPNPDDVDAARTALDQHGRTLTDFIGASLAELAADPGAVLARLAPHWPPPARRGRPPRTPAE